MSSKAKEEEGGGGGRGGGRGRWGGETMKLVLTVMLPDLTH